MVEERVTSSPKCQTLLTIHAFIFHTYSPTPEEATALPSATFMAAYDHITTEVSPVHYTENEVLSPPDGVGSILTGSSAPISYFSLYGADRLRKKSKFLSLDYPLS